MDSDYRNTQPSRGDFEQNDSLPWVEKYRPTSLDNVISQDDIVATRILGRCVFRNSQTFHRRKSPPSFTVLWTSRYWKDNDYYGLCKDVIW